MEPQRILITGVSSGLGYALASLYLSARWKVYGLSRNYPDGQQGNPNLYFQSLDLADLNYIPSALASLLSHVRRLDLVVLNAGVLCPIADMQDSRMDDLQYAMTVNVWANKVLMDTLFQRGIDSHQPHICVEGGAHTGLPGGRATRSSVIEVNQVVAISSGASVSGLRGWNGYAISKAALNMMIQLYAQEQPHTHFTALAPGVVDTPMQDYISSLPDVDKFPTIVRLQRMKGTAEMPSADGAAHRLAQLFPRLQSLPSGSYTDARKM